MSAIRNAIYRFMKPFVLMAFSFILITACYQPVIQKPYTLTGDLEGFAKCRVVQHALGESCIPAHPQRIILLDEFYLLDYTLALGIKPVGFAHCPYCIPPYTRKFVTEVPIVGGLDNPSLEKILSLKPDLILGLEWHKDFYPLLSAIAPTVIIENPEAKGFKKVLTYLAEILNKSEQVEVILAQYNERIQLFRQQLGEKLKTKTVSILGIHGSSFYVEKLESRIYGQVMSDTGVQFIPAYKDLKNDFTVVSIETLRDWDADFLIVIYNYQRHSKDIKLILKQPMWSTLKSVQNKQVHIMSLDAWGPITVNRFIDDLYEYFINTP